MHGSTVPTGCSRQSDDCILVYINSLNVIVIRSDYGEKNVHNKCSIMSCSTMPGQRYLAVDDSYRPSVLPFCVVPQIVDCLISTCD